MVTLCGAVTTPEVLEVMVIGTADGAVTDNESVRLTVLGPVIVTLVGEKLNDPLTETFSVSEV
jgi:hypothetical protein